MGKGKRGNSRQLPKRRRPDNAPSPVARRSDKATAGDYRKLQTLASMVKEGQIEDAEAELQRMMRSGVSPHALAEGEMMLADVKQEWDRLADAGERALKFKSNDPQLLNRVIQAHLMAGRVCSAKAAANAVGIELEIDASGGRRADKVQHEIAKDVERRVESTGRSGEEGLKIFAQHEHSMMLLQLGKYQQAASICRQLIQQHPQFPLPWNNLALMLFHAGDYDGAFEAAQAAAQHDRQRAMNALMHIRIGFLTGHDGDPDNHLDRFVENPPRGDQDALNMLLETLAMLGRDQDLLEVCESVGDDFAIEDTSVDGLNHLHAYALARTGQIKQALELWESCNYPQAAENLDDFEEDSGHMPFALSPEHWIPRAAMEQLIQGSAPTMLQAVTRLLPHLWDRGDEAMRKFAMAFTNAHVNQETTAALRSFATGKRGPRTMRLQAIQTLSERGEFSDESPQIWNEKNGEFEEFNLVQTEIYHGPNEADFVSEEVDELVNQAHEARMEDDFDLAESVYRQALELDPKSASIRNNLIEISMARGDKDAWKNALNETRAILEDHPDYLFGQVTLARNDLMSGHSEAARERVEPFLKATRLHVTEASTLYGCLADIEIAEGKLKAAQNSLDMLVGIVGKDNDLVQQIESRLDDAKMEGFLHSVPRPKGASLRSAIKG